MAELVIAVLGLGSLYIISNQEKKPKQLETFQTQTKKKKKNKKRKKK